MKFKKELSPWQRCAACEGCEWWTGWQCRQEGIGYRDCAAYGVAFVDTVVAVDRLTGAARYVVLKKGQTPEELMASTAAPEELKNAWADLGHAQGLNVLTYFDE